MTRARALMSIIAIAGGLAAHGPASAAPVPAGASWQEVYFRSFDGTPLHGDLLLPADGCPEDGCPVVVSVGPYFGSGSQASPIYNPLNAGPSRRFYDFITYEFPDRGNVFAQGYAWLQVDSRGYGGSGGCNDYGGLGEQLDVAAAIEYAGTQAWSNGKVGMWGKSYDGWTQVMGLAHNPPHLEAVVVQSPIIEGYGIAYVNGVHHQAGWYGTTSLYMLYDYLPPSLNQMSAEEAVYPALGTATDPCWVAQQAIIAAGWDHDLEFWRQRDLRARAGRNDDVAVLWSHGFNDVNTKPDQIFGVYEPLNALPRSNHRAWFGQWAHDRGNLSNVLGRDGFLEEAIDWFDHYLKGRPFRFGVNERNVVEIQDNEGRWRTEASYPPSDVRSTELPLRAGTYTDNGVSSASEGYWTFSQPVTDDLRVAGEPTLHVDVDILAPFANLIGVLYDYDPATGIATELSRGAYRLEEDGPASFKLQPRDHIYRAGHRIAFHITSGHREYFPHSTRVPVTVTRASVSVPFLTYDRVVNLNGRAGQRRSYMTWPAAEQVSSSAIEMGLPRPMQPYPDAETREMIQPTVTSPGG